MNRLTTTTFLVAAIVGAGRRDAQAQHVPESVEECAAQISSLPITTVTTTPVGGQVPGVNANLTGCASYTWVQFPGKVTNIKVGGLYGGPNINTSAGDCAHSTIAYALYKKLSDGSWTRVGFDRRFGALLSNGFCSHSQATTSIDVGTGWQQDSSIAGTEYRLGIQSWQHNDPAIGHPGNACATKSCLWPSVVAVATLIKYNPGDVDGDGKADIALTGGVGWGSIPVAHSNGDGTYWVSNNPVTDIPTYAASSLVKALSGDFNGDGKADIALTGPNNWISIPLALGTGSGNFDRVDVHNGAGSFPAIAALAGARIVSGDFNGDGKSDLAATSGTGWGSIPVAFSYGDGTFNVTNVGVANFPAWAQSAGARPVAGDFNGDGRDDIALTGVAGWGTIPVAFSNGDGTFNITNGTGQSFPGWAAAAGAKFASGDFNGDGRDDLVATGAAWSDIKFAYSAGNGNFASVTRTVSSFPSWAQNANAKPLALDVNGDGFSDLVLTSGTGWGTVPTILNLGNSQFRDPPVNSGAGSFPGWASTANVKALGGH